MTRDDNDRSLCPHRLPSRTGAEADRGGGVSVLGRLPTDRRGGLSRLISGFATISISSSRPTSRSARADRASPKASSVASSSSWPVLVAHDLSASFLFFPGACPGEKSPARKRVARLDRWVGRCCPWCRSRRGGGVRGRRRWPPWDTREPGRQPLRNAALGDLLVAAGASRAN